MVNGNYDIIEKIVAKLKALPDLFSALVQKVNDVAQFTETALTADDIANDLTTEDSGKVLDARQGKALNTAIGENATAIGVNSTAITGLQNAIQTVTIKDADNIVIQKSANIISMRSVNASASASDIRAVTIPESYRPAKKVDIALFEGTGGYHYHGYVSVNVDGTVTIIDSSGNVDTTSTFASGSFNGCWAI